MNHRAHTRVLTLAHVCIIINNINGMKRGEREECRKRKRQRDQRERKRERKSYELSFLAARLKPKRLARDLT